MTSSPTVFNRLASGTVLCIGVVICGLFAVPWLDSPSHLVLVTRLFAWAAPTTVAVILIHRLRLSHQTHERAREALTTRSATVDRLLDFSQTIGGAGKPEQIYPTLAHALRTEFGLTGVVILAQEPESVPMMQIKSGWPESLVTSGASIADMDTALCPCLRAGLPRTFRGDGAPVRCAVDATFSFPVDEPAYCIPFNIGRSSQVLVHMLLPKQMQWTEALRQLAQTYVNTASSTLITLHHLAEAEKQSMTDALTGLYNRRSMDQLLQREVALAERHKVALSLVMIDMDEFKQINDAHGHAAGDYMLRAFADCVRITLRKTDLAFRYGGDEFVIALPQTSVAQAQQVVQKLRQAFGSVDFSSAVANLDHQPTMSVGLAERSAANNVLTLPTILAASDTALYEAKNASRNCVRVYSPPRAA